jgi:hypothetical protein
MRSKMMKQIPFGALLDALRRTDDIQAELRVGRQIIVDELICRHREALARQILFGRDVTPAQPTRGTPPGYEEPTVRMSPSQKIARAAEARLLHVKALLACA